MYCITYNLWDTYHIQYVRRQLLEWLNIGMEITEEKFNKLNSITGARWIKDIQLK